MMTDATLIRTINALSSQIDELRGEHLREGDAISPRETSHPPVHHRTILAICLMNRALYQAASGFPEQALADYDDALPLYFKHGSRMDIATCLVNRAMCLMTLGRPQVALADYDSALFLYRAQNSPSGLATCLKNRATCLGSLNRWDEAMANYIEAAQFMKPSSIQHAHGGHDDSVKRSA